MKRKDYHCIWLHSDHEKKWLTVRFKKYNIVRLFVVGYCWSGEISNNNIQLLQRGPWYYCGLWCHRPGKCICVVMKWCKNDPKWVQASRMEILFIQGCVLVGKLYHTWSEYKQNPPKWGYLKVKGCNKLLSIQKLACH